MKLSFYIRLAHIQGHSLLYGILVQAAGITAMAFGEDIVNAFSHAGSALTDTLSSHAPVVNRMESNPSHDGTYYFSPAESPRLSEHPGPSYATGPASPMWPSSQVSASHSGAQPHQGSTGPSYMGGTSPSAYSAYSASPSSQYSQGQGATYFDPVSQQHSYPASPDATAYHSDHRGYGSSPQVQSTFHSGQTHQAWTNNPSTASQGSFYNTQPDPRYSQSSGSSVPSGGPGNTYTPESHASFASYSGPSPYHPQQVSPAVDPSWSGSGGGGSVSSWGQQAYSTPGHQPSQGSFSSGPTAYGAPNPGYSATWTNLGSSPSGESMAWAQQPHTRATSPSPGSFQFSQYQANSQEYVPGSSSFRGSGAGTSSRSSYGREDDYDLRQGSRWETATERLSDQLGELQVGSRPLSTRSGGSNRPDGSGRPPVSHRGSRQSSLRQRRRPSHSGSLADDARGQSSRHTGSGSAYRQPDKWRGEDEISLGQPDPSRGMDRAPSLSGHHDPDSELETEQDEPDRRSAFMPSRTSGSHLRPQDSFGGFNPPRRVESTSENQGSYRRAGSFTFNLPEYQSGPLGEEFLDQRKGREMPQGSGSSYARSDAVRARGRRSSFEISEMDDRESPSPAFRTPSMSPDRARRTKAGDPATSEIEMTGFQSPNPSRSGGITPSGGRSPIPQGWDYDREDDLFSDSTPNRAGAWSPSMFSDRSAIPSKGTGASSRAILSQVSQLFRKKDSSSRSSDRLTSSEHPYQSPIWERAYSNNPELRKKAFENSFTHVSQELEEVKDLLGLVQPGKGAYVIDQELLSDPSLWKGGLGPKKDPHGSWSMVHESGRDLSLSPSSATTSPLHRKGKGAMTRFSSQASLRSPSRPAWSPSSSEILEMPPKSGPTSPMRPSTRSKDQASTREGQQGSPRTPRESSDRHDGSLKERAERTSTSLRYLGELIKSQPELAWMTVGLSGFEGSFAQHLAQLIEEYNSVISSKIKRKSTLKALDKVATSADLLLKTLQSGVFPAKQQKTREQLGTLEALRQHRPDLFPDDAITTYTRTYVKPWEDIHGSLLQMAYSHSQNPSLEKRPPLLVPPGGNKDDIKRPRSKASWWKHAPGFWEFEQPREKAGKSRVTYRSGSDILNHPSPSLGEIVSESPWRVSVEEAKNQGKGYVQQGKGPKSALTSLDLGTLRLKTFVAPSSHKSPLRREDAPVIHTQRWGASLKDAKGPPGDYGSPFDHDRMEANT